jgi:hypothetical protein
MSKGGAEGLSGSSASSRSSGFSGSSGFSRSSLSSALSADYSTMRLALPFISPNLPNRPFVGTPAEKTT